MGGWLCPGPADGGDRPDACSVRVRSEQPSGPGGRCLACTLLGGVVCSDCGEEPAVLLDEDSHEPLCADCAESRDSDGYMDYLIAQD